MNEEEIFKMLLIESIDKFPLLNELFAIRDSRGKRNDYTIFVNGYISLDVINKTIEKVNLLNNLKEIEKLHKEENGKLRAEFEKVYEDNLTLAHELDKEKEKNKELKSSIDYLQKIEPEKLKIIADSWNEKVMTNLEKEWICKDKIREIVNECLEKKKDVITDKEEYCFNVNDNSFLAHRIVELLEGK